uniref:Uncharacterized protein n=1 Tax=Aureoumbra lagunensis TaxID=44058 RepID=A0A7S3NMR0_9STRA|mmetsp:Transcript_8126/g.11316  ORF Transcript_8126/g.11316 Transcript_8126/m.11316 type:complete len:399 (-) Transcript_8126:1458-2654(-)|eukprot:CAMPEP_0197289786 /NCGR_PEP_ID=MMETSP0890-20130614/7055_1 /TAXON_ID=44058 ORGANISM="Aureoumbra lagunensis, Strain CCMP1510" /NCGR_SAMPLE_ID=MMETSP0890 /ASSEMBLY_ACC=CAM_ASM_000533 /LENGTH=398 /DNA_ID=CAMNT_0042761411 /DNA_START=42 /DNA_END=1238 /DNA_ORIENTATION=+
MLCQRAAIRGAVRGISFRSRRSLSAALSSFEDDIDTIESISGLSQSSKIESSSLPNGIEVISTGQSASSVIAVKLNGVGSADGATGAGFAASLMAFKTANGMTDLARQRPLELAGLIPHAKVLKSSLVLAIEGTPNTAEMATSAIGLSLGIDRDSYVDWEFDETMKAAKFPPPDIDTCIETAAFGEGSFLARPVISKSALSSLVPETIESLIASAISQQPITFIGIGIDHADAISVAARTFAQLSPRNATSIPPIQFIHGGFASKTSAIATTACAAALPADSLLAGVLSFALSPPPGVILQPTESGLLVAKGAASKQSLIKLLSTDIDHLTSDDFAAAKLRYKTYLLSKSSLDLAFAIADGSYLAAANGALDTLSLDQAKATLKGIEPAFAVVAPSDD